MAAFVVEDVVEEILIRLDVKDLIRYKSVCKSWHSLITSSRFINRHVNHSYNKDRCNNKLSHRRISLNYEFLGSYKGGGGYHLVGSSNGLVCIIYGYNSKFVLGNPLTREVRQLKIPPWIGLSVCWGFGYDSSVDDYKVVVWGQRVWTQTCLQVLSLKSNVWKVIGDVKHTFISKVGVLCNGALHWIVYDQNFKKLIISYDLYKEEIEEIALPDDARYKFTSSSYLGIMKECLCIFHRSGYFADDVWLMENYKVNQSWKLLSSVNETDYDIVHFLRSPKVESFFADNASWFPNTLQCHGRFGKWCLPMPCNNKRDKLIKGPNA